MKQFLGRLSGLFATQTLTGHLIRGALAFALLWFAIAQQHLRPVASVLAALLALVAMRCCPVVLDDRAGGNHRAALWGDAKPRSAAQPPAGEGVRPRPELDALSRSPACSAPARSSVPRSSWSSLRARSPWSSPGPSRAGSSRQRCFRSRVLGAALVVAGLPILLDSFARFALQGLGTPAPVMRPSASSSPGSIASYNPMYVAVTALIAGQGLLFGSVTLLGYGADCRSRSLFSRRLRDDRHDSDQLCHAASAWIRVAPDERSPV